MYAVMKSEMKATDEDRIRIGKFKRVEEELKALI